MHEPEEPRFPHESGEEGSYFRGRLVSFAADCSFLRRLVAAVEVN
jgi:hypothetical protein